MINILKAGVLSLALAGGLLLPSASSFGTVAFSKKEKTACTTCHVKVGSKELNKVGQCYKKNHHNLKACESKSKSEKK